MWSASSLTIPNDWLVDAVLLEHDENWQLEGRRMFFVENMAEIPSLDGSACPVLPAGSNSLSSGPS
jgi:hypothetical protein